MLKPTLNCLVWYKGRPALVSELGEKITITLEAGKKTETVKVREKDIEVLHPGPLYDLKGLADTPSLNKEKTDSLNQNLHEVWELIESGGVPVNLKELADLAYGEFTPQSALAARLLLSDGLYFTGTADALSARSKEEISAIKDKRQGKEKETLEREAFLERLRSGAFDPKEDSRFLQDVEALAYGKTEKSRTMKELGRTETPTEAHRLLLECGYWNKQFNPYPRRFGISLSAPETSAADEILLELSDTLERRDLTHLPALAIDSPWSTDPDDALSLECQGARRILYVHVADPGSLVENGSRLDEAARARGTTLYLPEGTWPMLNEKVVSHFALGIKETPGDKALSIKITLDEDGAIFDTEIFPSVIKVTRLSFEEADKLLEEGNEKTGNTSVQKNASLLEGLHALTEANLRRRLDAGAVNITLPEVYISVTNRKIKILPIIPCQSAEIVRECMLLAGEGAAAWAAQRQLPFPYITQETGDLPSKPLSGLAGSCQLRRCMRPRSVSAKPGYHWGLGLESYSQVTSPIRRYTDLLAHQQIRAFLCKEAGLSKKEPLNEEELLFCLAAGDSAFQSANQAERASKFHWTAVYLDELLASDPKAELLWDAVITEKRSNGVGIIIPDLAIETQITGTGSPNDTIKVQLKSVRIPELEMNFVKP